MKIRRCRANNECDQKTQLNCHINQQKYSNSPRIVGVQQLLWRWRESGVLVVVVELVLATRLGLFVHEAFLEEQKNKSKNKLCQKKSEETKFNDINHTAIKTQHF